MLFRMREDPKEGLEESSWSRIMHCPFFLAFFCHTPRRCVSSTSQLRPESDTEVCNLCGQQILDSYRAY